MLNFKSYLAEAGRNILGLNPVQANIKDILRLARRSGHFDVTPGGSGHFKIISKKTGRLVDTASSDPGPKGRLGILSKLRDELVALGVEKANVGSRGIKGLRQNTNVPTETKTSVSPTNPLQRYSELTKLLKTRGGAIGDARRRRIQLKIAKLKSRIG